MDPYIAAVSNIIKEQQLIIGPVAIEQAKKVVGISMTDITNIKIEGNKKEVLGNLVNNYARLFGNVSIQVCKEAMQPYLDKIPTTEIPDILKN